MKLDVGTKVIVHHTQEPFFKSGNRGVVVESPMIAAKYDMDSPDILWVNFSGDPTYELPDGINPNDPQNYIWAVWEESMEDIDIYLTVVDSFDSVAYDC